ncbi:MAG: lipopolysaccharide assembly protein LapA domain-containing protein [Ktedonobacteraceae bacterium]
MLIVVLIIFILMGGALAVLAYENFATLMIESHLTLFGWHAPALPLGVLLLLACLLGALPLYMVTVLAALRDRRQLAKLRQRVAELEQGQNGQAPAQYALPLIVPMPGIQANQPRKPPYTAR